MGCLGTNARSKYFAIFSWVHFDASFILSMSNIDVINQFGAVEYQTKRACTVLVAECLSVYAPASYIFAAQISMKLLLCAAANALARNVSCTHAIISATEITNCFSSSDYFTFSNHFYTYPYVPYIDSSINIWDKFRLLYLN